MKNLILAVTFLVGIVSYSYAQQSQQKLNGAIITFDKVVHDYGTVEKGANGDCVFTFKNEGNEPLILSGASASCGCTVPTYTREPIMPGKTGTIKVRYNKMNQVGGIGQSITVTSNAVNENRVTLRISGKVVESTVEKTE